MGTGYRSRRPARSRDSGRRGCWASRPPAVHPARQSTA